MSGHQRSPGVDDVLLRLRHVHVVLLAQDQHAEELPAFLGADHRRVQGNAGRRQVLGRQRRGAHRHHADPLARRQGGLHPGHLQQGAGRDRDLHLLPPAPLEQRQEPAIGGDGLGAVPHQLGGRFEEVRQQPRGAFSARPAPALRRAPPGRAPGRARSWRCPCRPGCAETAPPASGCRAARRRGPCRLLQWCSTLRSPQAPVEDMGILVARIGVREIGDLAINHRGTRLGQRPLGAPRDSGGNIESLTP